MDKQYVERRGEDYWIAGSRVSLESVILAFRDGLSPETIAAECFPALTLEQVYGAIAYYLGNRPILDAYLRQMEADDAAFQQTTRDPQFSQKMARERRVLAA